MTNEFPPPPILEPVPGGSGNDAILATIRNRTHAINNSLQALHWRVAILERAMNKMEKLLIAVGLIIMGDLVTLIIRILSEVKKP